MWCRGYKYENLKILNLNLLAFIWGTDRTQTCGHKDFEFEFVNIYMGYGGYKHVNIKILNLNLWPFIWRIQTCGHKIFDFESVNIYIGHKHNH